MPTTLTFRWWTRVLSAGLVAPTCAAVMVHRRVAPVSRTVKLRDPSANRRTARTTWCGSGSIWRAMRPGAAPRGSLDTCGGAS